MNGPLRTLSTIWILLLSALTRAHDVRYIGTWWYNYGYRYSETWDSYASISVDLTIDDWSEVVIQAEGYYGAVAMSSYEARELQVTVGGEVQTVAPGEVTIPRSAFGSLTMGEVVLSVPPACDGMTLFSVKIGSDVNLIAGTTTIASQPSTRTNAATPESSGGQESLTRLVSYHDPVFNSFRSQLTLWPRLLSYCERIDDHCRTRYNSDSSARHCQHI